MRRIRAKAVRLIANEGFTAQRARAARAGDVTLVGTPMPMIDQNCFCDGLRVLAARIRARSACGVRGEVLR